MLGIRDCFRFIPVTIMIFFTPENRTGIIILSTITLCVPTKRKGIHYDFIFLKSSPLLKALWLKNSESTEISKCSAGIIGTLSWVTMWILYTRFRNVHVCFIKVKSDTA